MLSFGFFVFSVTPALAWSCNVRLYAHSHTTEDSSEEGSNKCTLHENDHILTLNNAKARNAGCPGQNEISRIKVEGPCYVDLYHGSLYSGKHQRIWEAGDYYAHSPAFDNDEINSLKIFKYQSCYSYQPYTVNGHCARCRVTFAQHNSANANSMGVWCEKKDSEWVKNMNHLGYECPDSNDLSAVKIEGNCYVELWENDNYSGHKWVLSGSGFYGSTFTSSGNFENDEVNSFKIRTGSGRRRGGVDEDENVTYLISDEERTRFGLGVGPRYGLPETNLIERVEEVQDSEEWDAEDAEDMRLESLITRLITRNPQDEEQPFRQG